jgi:molecular chaperone GrpE
VNSENETELIAPMSDNEQNDFTLESPTEETTTLHTETGEAGIFNMSAESEELSQEAFVPNSEALRIVTFQDEPELFTQLMGISSYNYLSENQTEETITQHDLTDDANETDETDETNEIDELDLSEAVEELSQEVRRVGRELFKTNRASQRNQEMFETALDDLQQLSVALSQFPSQSEELVFQTKASLCRDLLRVIDTMETSLNAAADVLIRLEENSQQPTQGLLFRFQIVRALKTSLEDSADAMGQWLNGQQLLYERLLAVLQETGVRPITAVGRPFDSSLHRAVAVEQHDDMPDGIVVGEELKGYTLDGRVLRYAEVVVTRQNETG